MKQPKRPYQKPEVKKIGNLKDISQTASNGGKTDGGAFPANKHMCLTPPPTIEEHRILLADVLTQNSYRNEIMNTVKPGDVVLDLGTGSGIHTLFALQAGAKKVYAIDIDSIINLAKEVIRDNGFEQQVEFIKQNSRDLDLPEKVDVIISNIGFLHTLNDLPDVALRFLKPDGQVLPSSAKISFAPITVESFYETNVNNWRKNEFNLDFSAFRKIAASHPLYLELKTENILCDAYTSDAINFAAQVPKHLHWSMEFTAKGKSISHGIGGWYQFFNQEKSYLSTQPPLKLSPELWSNFIFPFEEPLQLNANDHLQVQIEMHREELGDAPIWRWSVNLNGTKVFDQNSFQAFNF